MSAALPELTMHQRDLVAMGLCPFCEHSIKGWKPVSGAFAPEWYETMREHGIDPSTGHKADCIAKKVRL